MFGNNILGDRQSFPNNKKLNITMAKYKLVEMADMDKTGTRKVYPKMVTYRTLSTEEFIKKMKWYNNALPTSAIEAALTDMCNILARMLAMGYNVNLDGLGTFSLSLGFEDEKTTEMQHDDGTMYVAVHSGSRHLGKEVTEYYLKCGQRELKEQGVEVPYELTWLTG